MSNLENLQASNDATDDEGRSKVANRIHRVNRILAISKYADVRIVQWLTSVVKSAELHPEVSKLIETSSLGDSLLTHEEQSKDVVAGQIRKLNLPFVYAIKENRKPYYVSAVREMLLNPSVDSLMYQKGNEYLWSVGKPESVEVFQELYDHKGPDDYKARMHLCEALIHCKDPRGLPEALAVMADSFGNAPESPDEKVLKANLKLSEDKRSQSLEVLERANDEMLFAAVLTQIHSENIGMRSAILHALRSRNSLPAAVIDSVRSWSKSNAPFLSAEARDFITLHGIEASLQQTALLQLAFGTSSN